MNLLSVSPPSSGKLRYWCSQEKMVRNWGGYKHLPSQEWCSSVQVLRTYLQREFSRINIMQVQHSTTIKRDCLLKFLEIPGSGSESEPLVRVLCQSSVWPGTARQAESSLLPPKWDSAIPAMTKCYFCSQRLLFHKRGQMDLKARFPSSHLRRIQDKQKIKRSSSQIP